MSNINFAELGVTDFDIGMSIDTRHLEWMHYVLSNPVGGPWLSSLESGSWKGVSSSVFVDAANKGHILRAMFADINFQPQAIKVIGGHEIFHGKGADAIRINPPFDVVFLDSDHRLAPTQEEWKAIIAKPELPRLLVAHDTNSVNLKLGGCEGPAWLYNVIVNDPSYYWVHDCEQRDNERTDRGLFMATKDENILEVIMEGYRATCFA